MGFSCTGRRIRGDRYKGDPRCKRFVFNRGEMTVTVGHPFMNVHWKMLGVLGSLLSPLHKNESMSSFFSFGFNVQYFIIFVRFTKEAI